MPTPSHAESLPPAPGEGGPRRGKESLADLAYQRMEEMLVRCELQPGRFLAMHELQTLIGFGRTPVHQAVARFAADTLMVVSPRHGVQIAPIDLTRERLLLDLRRDVERFVVQLATRRAGASHRNQMMHIRRQLIEHGAGMGIDRFNLVDRRIDQLMLSAAAEPFVESTLRPLHTVFRRLGWIFHTHAPGENDVRGSIEGHIAVIDAVASQNLEGAIAASDRLMDFVADMFVVLEREVPPQMLDCSVAADAHLFAASPRTAAGTPLAPGVVQALRPA